MVFQMRDGSIWVEAEHACVIFGKSERSNNNLALLKFSFLVKLNKDRRGNML